MSKIRCCLTHSARPSGVKWGPLFISLTRYRWSTEVVCLCSVRHQWAAQPGPMDPLSRWVPHLASRWLLAVGWEVSPGPGCLSHRLLHRLLELPPSMAARGQGQVSQESRVNVCDPLRSHMASLPPYSASRGCHRGQSNLIQGEGTQDPLTVWVECQCHRREEECKLPSATGHPLYDAIYVTAKSRQN